jgi:hypothetical protein
LSIVNFTTVFARYLEMVEHLHSGHPGYNLADAQTVRQKILKAAETVDALSKKISFLGIKLPPEGATPEEREQ